MTDYSRHLNARRTPQSDAVPGREADMAANRAGGFAFKLDKWAQLDRFLVLGAEGGTYYASEREMTRENAGVVVACAREDGGRAVGAILRLRRGNRAPKMSPLLFALVWRDGNPSGKASVVHVSGTTMSRGSTVTFLNANLSAIAVAAVSSTKVVVGYVEITGWTGVAKVGTVSGMDITFGSVATFDGNANVDITQAVGLGDGSRMVFAYSRSGVRAVVGTVSGTTVSFGTPALVTSAYAGSYLDVAALSSSRMMVVYMDSGSDYVAVVKEGTVSGADITFGSVTSALNTYWATSIGASALSSTAMVVSYRDGGDSNHGTANVVTH